MTVHNHLLLSRTSIATDASKRVTQPSKPIKPTEEPIIGSSSLVSHPEPGTSEILKRPSRWARGSILECNNRSLLLLQPSHPPRGCFCPVRERCGCLTREISHSSTQRMLLPVSKRRKLSGKSFFDIIYSWSRYFRGTKKSMCHSVCRINELKMPDPPVSSFDPLILHPCGICASWSLDALLDYGCREEGALVEAVMWNWESLRKILLWNRQSFRTRSFESFACSKQLSFQQYPVPRK